MDYSSHFSIQNIPYGIASNASHPEAVPVTRLGNSVIFLKDLNLETTAEVKTALSQTSLNSLAALDKGVQRQLRQAIQKALSDEQTVSKHGVPVDQVKMHLPFEIKAFTDFSCSRDHMLNMGEAILGKRSLPPSALHFPIGYSGRASSVVVSGTPIARPNGQFKQGDDVVLGPTRQLDYELELGCFIGKPSKLGERIRIENADDHIFGVVLVNDWSARDIQSFEMMPLGPISGKSFGTTISPWVVTLEALEPFRAAAPAKEFPPKPYLTDPLDKASYTVSVRAEILPRDDSGGGGGGQASVLGSARMEWMYWTFRDVVAQQSLNGCNLQTGDLLATGTLSGAGDDEHGCLAEMTMGGKKDVGIAGGKRRMFLEDGDAVRLTAVASEGVGFGDCIGVILPAVAL